MKSGTKDSKKEPSAKGIPRKPEWLRVRLGHGKEHQHMREILSTHRLHTVCEEALCPNIGECWGCGHATIMLMGGTCTRNCRFCNVSDRKPSPPEQDEPQRVANAVSKLKLKHIVLTSVTRDDLADGGSRIWAETIMQVRKAAPQAVIEVLIPDFKGETASLKRIIAAHPDILGHNLETVPRLYSQARPQADYHRSLNLLKNAAAAGCITKTGLMLGMGENEDEIKQVIMDAVAAHVAILYLGQYLQPSKEHLPVVRYFKPREFEALREYALTAGFPVVAAGPLIRSSYPSTSQTEYLQKAEK